MSLYVITPEYFSDVCTDVLREPMSRIGLENVRTMAGSGVRFYSEASAVYMATDHASGSEFSVQMEFEARWGRECIGAPTYWFAKAADGAGVDYCYSNVVELKELLPRMFDECVVRIGVVLPGREVELRHRVQEFYQSIGEDLKW